MRPIPGQPIRVSPFFPDSTLVTDLYTGQTATVRNGTITFPRHENSIAILHPAN